MNSPVVSSSIPISMQSALGAKRDMSSQGVLKFQFWVGENVGGEVGTIVGSKVGAKVGEIVRGEVGDGVGARVKANTRDLVGTRVGGLDRA